VVVLRAETQELRTLPYDLLQAGRQLSFSLRDLFPNLSYPCHPGTRSHRPRYPISSSNQIQTRATRGQHHQRHRSDKWL
jgi:hypothetical protein